MPEVHLIFAWTRRSLSHLFKFYSLRFPSALRTSFLTRSPRMLSGHSPASHSFAHTQNRPLSPLSHPYLMATFFLPRPRMA